MIIAGTGHRPKFLPCKYNENHPWFKQLYVDLLDTLSMDKPEAVISGMALGWDTWLAEAAIELGIPVWSFIPFHSQGSNWPSKSLARYNRILDQAEIVYIVNDNYSNQSFFNRDEMMVDCSDIMYALWNPELTSGGTYHTVSYADNNKIPVCNFWREQ